VSRESPLLSLDQYCFVSLFFLLLKSSPSRFGLLCPPRDPTFFYIASSSPHHRPLQVFTDAQLHLVGPYHHGVSRHCSCGPASPPCRCRALPCHCLAPPGWTPPLFCNWDSPSPYSIWPPLVCYIMLLLLLYCSWPYVLFCRATPQPKS